MFANFTNLGAIYTEDQTVYAPGATKWNITVLSATVMVQFSYPLGVNPKGDPFLPDEQALPPGTYSLDRRANSARFRSPNAGALVTVNTI